MKILEDRDNKFAFKIAISALLFSVVMFFPYKNFVNFFIEAVELKMVFGYLLGAVLSAVNFAFMARDIKKFINSGGGEKKAKVKNFLRFFAFFSILLVLVKRLSVDLLGLVGGVVLFQLGIFVGFLVVNKLDEQKR